MKRLHTILLFCLLAVPVLCCRVSAADPQPPEYLLKARSMLAEATSRAGEIPEAADEISFAKNYLLRAEKEYDENLSWGKLKEKAEPVVRYYAGLARLQAAIVLARAGRIDQDRERLRLEGVAAGVKSRIKVFDDKLAEIAALKGELGRRDSSIAALTQQTVALKTELEQLTAARRADAERLGAEKKQETDRLTAQIETMKAELMAKAAALSSTQLKGSDASRELLAKQQLISGLELKIAEVNKALAAAKADNQKLAADMAALAAQKGAVESQSREQIEALNRQKEFVAEVGKLGGVIKSGSDNMTVIFVRSAVIKAPKNDSLSADGSKTVARIVDLLKRYPEFRLKVKVHGYGQPAKNEDAAATDRMARLIREALIEKGGLEPAAVEALGVGSADPVYPKNNPEGNRRVEVTFVRK